jgi:alpha-D-ribose 1-methylphosphonate 5-triphosphate diphosphatase
MNTHILTNARIVTPTGNFTGSVRIENGMITDILRDRFFPEGINLQEQWLIPGCIDIHSDYLERELHPRPGASFPLSFALHFLDARAAACGITTVFSAISFSDSLEKERSIGESIKLSKEMDTLRDSLLVRHYLHARIDPNSNALLPFLPEIAALESLYLVVYNENIPGERQFTLDQLIERRVKSEGITPEVARERLLRKAELTRQVNNRQAIFDQFKDHCILGSHDDTTEAHVWEALQFGATLSEMPTRLEAAKKARELGLDVCMGAPNYFRGGSHCGNLSCGQALEEGLVDILCSDYHFPTMLGSVVRMIDEGMDPSAAVNLVSLNPARLLKFDKETGSIEAGKSADLVVFDSKHSFASVSRVFVNGINKLTARYAGDNRNSIRSLTRRRSTASVRQDGAV